MRNAIVAALCVLGLSAPATAQVTQTYFYDAQGRLTATANAPAVGGAVVRYGLDSSDNRTSRLSETVPTRATVHELQSGQFIVAGQFVPSADGRFALYVQLDGNVVLYGPPGFLWGAVGTWGQQSTTLTMQTDGNLTVRGPSNNLIWQSATGGHPGARMVVQNDGNLVVYDGWTAIWSTGTCCY